MNPESLKSELQQVLDNDLAIRKEFTELRRSLGDYRNQLIMRDEDCKRLQVTIDVLNTKLSVFERDNNSLKAEIAGLRDAQGVLTGELASRHAELEGRSQEISELKSELSSLASEYEQRTAELRREAGDQLLKLQDQYALEIQEIRQNASASEELTRQTYEARLATMTADRDQREQELGSRHENELVFLRQAHLEELSLLRDQYNSTLAALSATSHEQQAELKLRYETTILELEKRLEESQGEIVQRHDQEISSLRSQMEEQRTALAAQFDLNLEFMAAEYAAREERARGGYETRIGELRAQLAETTEELTLNLENHLAAVRASHETLLHENNHAYETRIAELTNLYEEKISNLLIHANASGSRLNEELNALRLEAEQLVSEISGLHSQISEKDQNISELADRIGELELRLVNEQERTEAMASQQNPEIASTDALEEELVALKEEMSRQNRVHSEYVNELNGTIATLSDEIQNMSCVFTTVANDLGVSENMLDTRTSELQAANARIADLEAAAAEHRNYISPEEFGNRTSELLAAQELSYNKLLAENEGLISEIEEAQRQSELRQEEIDLLRSEMAAQHTSYESRLNELKETLDGKNQTISELETSQEGLRRELTMARQELSDLAGTMACSNDTGSSTELLRLQQTVNTLENELVALRSTTAGEQQSFIDKLLREIDAMNTQRLTLLDEKEQMAEQLLKMTEVIGNMSQQVDSEHIDVTGLNNHRKNAILAGNSKGLASETPMKKQINELVREIDKCIALLSA